VIASLVRHEKTRPQDRVLQAFTIVEYQKRYLTLVVRAYT
jgi:hypothetical protein